MKLQRQLLAIVIAGGIGYGAAQTATAESVTLVPKVPPTEAAAIVTPPPILFPESRPAPIPADPNINLAGSTVVPYPPSPTTPAPDIIIDRGVTNAPIVASGRPTFHLDTTPGYMAEQNARP